MAIGNAIIGALRVNLGLDSAAFTTGLKLAQGDLEKFSKFSKIGLIGLASAAAGVAAGLAIATKGAINHADAMSKMAQKAGVSTEALTRLAYAASYSDVSAEDLAGSLGKLSKSMQDSLITPTSTASIAFKALGIDVTDSSGKLRDADAVFAEVADRFAHLEDGSTKTALAMDLFGKSGANLIPFLNGGAADMQRLADEADRLGITLSTKTGRAAEKFNDTLAIIGNVFQGITNKIAEAALPALQRFADALTNPDFQQAAAQLAKWIVDAMTAITEAVGGAAHAIRDLWNAFTRPAGAGAAGAGVDDIKQQIADWKAYADAATDAISKGRAANEIAALQAELAARQAGTTTLGGSAFRGGWGAGGFDTSSASGGGDGTTQIINLTGAIKGAQDAIDPFEARVNELADVLTATVDPFSQMKLDLTDLKTMFDNGRISASQFGDAVFKTAAGGVGALADLAGGLTSALSEMFQKNKAIAVANAIVNGIGSVAKTFETYGATPWGFAAAGIAAATAAANVASILSTNESSKSLPGTSTASAASSATAATSAINLTVRGSGSINVDDFATQLAQSIADGGNQNLIKVIRAA